MAQDWPARPVTMVVPVAVGSSSDIVGRILAQRLSELLGQPVIVENAGGAGGMTGATRVARAAPDGYQFSIGNAGTHAINQKLYKNPLYNAATDFAPVALIAEVPHVLLARKDLPVGNLPEFIAYAKANQAKMQYGSGGVGSMPHLACEMLNKAIGVNTTHIPYRGGGGQSMPDLIAGRIDYFCALTAFAIPQIESKTVKAIAVFSKSRLPILPNLASAHEQGLSNFEFNPWYAFFLPKGTPVPVVQKLREAIVATTATPAVQEKLKELGYVPLAPERQSTEYLGKFVESEVEKWAAVIKAINIKPE
jgi:tripartite-type tricarboxylate transporter receptor subunit TctC